MSRINLDIAIANMECLEMDFDMLKDDTWIPDKYSIEASQDNVQEVLEFLRALKEEKNNHN